jgi:hypothetical protein
MMWKKFAAGFAGVCAGAGVWCASAGAQNQKAPDIVVTLLGTGSPIPEPGRLAAVGPHDRMNAMTLVRAGQEVLLFHGPLESGVDLMSFEIGDTVAVNRPM